MSTVQDFRNLVGGDTAAPESSSYHVRTDSDLTDDLLKSRSSVLNLSFSNEDNALSNVMSGLTNDLPPAAQSPFSNTSEMTGGSIEERSGDEGVEQNINLSSKSVRKHYRDHSYSRRSFDATFKQFEGRYKTHASFCPQQGVIRSEIVQYEELGQTEQKKSFLKQLNKKKMERVGSAQMVLHGSCLYFFRQDKNNVFTPGEESDCVRAVFVLDHCDFQIVPQEESTEAALDILPGGQQRLRVYLSSEENRCQWLSSLKESSPYHSADLITEMRQDVMQLQDELDSTRMELEATLSQCKYMQESQEAMRKEFQAEKEDFEEEISMLQDEQRVQRQMKNTQQGEFHATVQERDDLEDEMQQLLEQRDQMRDERVALRRHCQKMETEMREVKQKQQEKEREFKSLQKKLAKHVDAVEKLKRTAENYKAQAKETSEWRQKFKEMESFNIEMSEDLSALEEEYEVQQQEKDILRNAVSDLEKQVQQMCTERKNKDVEMCELADEVERLTNSKPSSSVNNSNNSNSTTREHQNRRRSDSFLDFGENGDQLGGAIQEDQYAMQRKLEIAQDRVRQQQMQINKSQKEINTLTNRIEAFDAYMEQAGGSKKQLEGEVKRLQLKVDELKRCGKAGAGNSVYANAPMDPEMIKDPAFHLEFVLQHASELAIENERLRAHLAASSNKDGLLFQPHTVEQPPTPTFNSSMQRVRGSRGVHSKVQSMTALEMI